MRVNILAYKKIGVSRQVRVWGRGGFGARSLVWVSVSFLGFWECGLLFTVGPPRSRHSRAVQCLSPGKVWLTDIRRWLRRGINRSYPKMLLWMYDDQTLNFFFIKYLVVSLK